MSIPGMQLKHVKALTEPLPGIARVQAVAWSPNNKRFAVVDHARVVQLYDESGERRDKFSLKAAGESKARTFVVRGMAFSPDSSKLAVAQSDFMLFVYKLGLEWGDKKGMGNKVAQTSAVMCMAWPHTVGSATEMIAFGTQEGKIKVVLLQTNKAQTLYSYEHAAVSIASSPDGNQIVSGHADGAIFRYTFETDDAQGGAAPSAAQKIAVHSCPPYAIGWGESIAVGGSDCRLSIYDRLGHNTQNFEFPVAEDKSLGIMAFSPSGQCMIVGAQNKLRVLNYNVRSRKWDEGAAVPLSNAYSVTALAWKADGSRLGVGTLCGAVSVFDACLKKYRLRGQYEFTYVSHNQVIVKRLSTGTRMSLKSYTGSEIQKLNVHKDRYLVAHTSSTLLIGDLDTCRLSEVPWQLNGRERFVFDNDKVCMVFVAGELCLIEYGKNELLGTCRTEETNMHRLSVCVHEATAASAATAASRKAVAFLMDRQTIEIDDLTTGVAVARVSHTSRIDWLELNHRATRLLYRDKQSQLFLYDIDKQQKTTLLNFCSYVQWVPDSDVVVGQNRSDLCVWYAIDTPDRVTIVPIKGEVEGIERTAGKTEVIVDEGASTVAYGLDESLIEFGSAMEERDYDRACDLLDQIAMAPETEAMWHNLSVLALQEMKLYIAERCYAALGDVAKASALNRINALAQEAAKESGGVSNGYDHYTVRAELFILNKEFKRAESVYLEYGKVEKAIEMWEEMQRFGDAIAVAESRAHPETASMRTRYFNWLMESSQEEKAGEVREREGKHIEAMNLYLRGGVPARAAHVVAAYNVRPEQQLLEAIATALFKASIFDKAGDFFEKLKMDDRAIDAYKSGHVYLRAVELARRVFPQRVESLEEAWADYLVSQKQVDQAINHYIEAKKPNKAVQSAIASRQWGKAVTILESQAVGSAEDAAVKNFFKQIARHYEEAHQLSEAEKYYIKAGAFNEAVELYSRRGMTDHMYRVAQRHLKQEEITPLFVDQAKQLEAKGDYQGAERIFIKVNEPDQAIVMYKRARDWPNMVRLVAAFRPDYLIKTYLALATQFEKEASHKLAEQYFVLGKDWGKAVDMYRNQNMWEDAVRVAKIHGGAVMAKQVVLSRALAVDAEEGVRMLIKFSMVDGGIEAAIEAEKFDIALQWAQLALPAKLPHVFLKWAMYWEDKGDFRQAEDAFVKAGKPREAIDMLVHIRDFDSAMRVAEQHDQSAIPIVCSAQGKLVFQAGNFKEAESLMLRANAQVEMLKLYRAARMHTDAQRFARQYCPEHLGDVLKEGALSMTDPLQSASMLEDNGQYELAIEAYLRANRQHTNDANQLVSAWKRAVRLANQHARPQLKETLKTAVSLMLEINRTEDAGKVLEESEDYKGAINVYARGDRFDLADVLAKRISPDLEEYLKRVRVQIAVEGGGGGGGGGGGKGADIDSLDREEALKLHIANGDWDRVMRLARQGGAEQTKLYAAMWVQSLVRDENVAKALEVLETHGMETLDFRFFSAFTQLAALLVARLPNDSFNLRLFAEGFAGVVESMRKTGQPEEQVRHADGLLHAVHIFATARLMREHDMKDLAMKVMLGLPRWVQSLPADKAYFDAGVAAREAGQQGIAFMYLSRYLDIVDKIEEGETDSGAMDNTDFATTDFPFNFKLPAKPTVKGAAAEEANQWVLTVSVERRTDVALPTVLCPKSGVKMFEGALRSPSGATYEECAITGYPILSGSFVRCRNCTRPANQEDWNRFVLAAKICPWCYTPQSTDFSLGNFKK